jgi:preprotein translocase subunit SecF
MKLLKLIPDNTNIKFQSWRFIALGVSIALVVASIFLVAFRGLNFGVDFAGGIFIEAGFEQTPNLNQMRTDLNALGLGEVSLQEFGNAQTIAIRLPHQPGDDAAQQVAVKKVQAKLRETNGEGVSFRRVETVGGKVSEELIRDGVLAIGLAMIAISIYIWFRFEWQFGVGAMLSLIHDVVITMGFFALTQMEFNLSSIAAVLTIVGYSLNDTVVVYDRIRENLKKYRKMGMIELLDLSVNETLSRTIMTSMCMAISLVALLIFGGDVIRGFTAAMLLGVVIGTYSSAYIAAPMLLWMKVSSNSFLPPETSREEKMPGKAAQ